MRNQNGVKTRVEHFHRNRFEIDSYLSCLGYTLHVDSFITFLDARLPVYLGLSIPITNAAAAAAAPARKSRGKFERRRNEAAPRKLVYTRSPRDSSNFGGGRSVVGGNSG